MLEGLHMHTKAWGSSSYWCKVLRTLKTLDNSRKRICQHKSQIVAQSEQECDGHGNDMQLVSASTPEAHGQE